MLLAAVNFLTRVEDTLSARPFVCLSVCPVFPVCLTGAVTVAKNGKTRHCLKTLLRKNYLVTAAQE
jgi:hypothetical protein